MVEIDYQLQLLSIQQQEHIEEEEEEEEVELQAELQAELAETQQSKDKMRLGNKSISSVEKAGGTLKRRISRAIKRSLSR